MTCLVSWRACLALAAAHKRKIDILDIKSAYLMADVKEDIYMQVPEGLKAPPGTCLKLQRSIYGLKQSGRAWNERLHEAMTSLGLRRSTADPCLYLLNKGTEQLTLNVHVDDCMITYSCEKT